MGGGAVKAHRRLELPPIPIIETWTPVRPSVRIGILPPAGNLMSLSCGAPGGGPWGGSVADESRDFM